LRTVFVVIFVAAFQVGLPLARESGEKGTAEKQLVLNLLLFFLLLRLLIFCYFGLFIVILFYIFILFLYPRGYFFIFASLR